MPLGEIVIGVPLVRRMIEAQFPQWTGLPITSVEPNGWDNRTFRLGNELSVRLPSDERYVFQVDKEHRWLPLLAPQLPLPIPEPVAKGSPSKDYPWSWSVYRWIEGENASVADINDLEALGRMLATFLTALQRISTSGGPEPGPHNFHRGGALATYDGQTRDAIQSLRERINADRALELWEKAVESSWQRPPVWVHGDVHATNLLVREGRLAAVIDFGCLAVGDPACDLTIAWTLLCGESRKAFHDAIALDDATWA